MLWCGMAEAVVLLRRTSILSLLGPLCKGRGGGGGVENFQKTMKMNFSTHREGARHKAPSGLID